MKKYLIVGLVLGTLISLSAQGRGTPNQLRVKTDANNYLMAVGAVQTNPISQPTLFSNTRLATDANGYLQVVITGGSVITGGTCTNQVVTAISAAGVPTCTTVTSAYVNSTILTQSGPWGFTAGDVYINRVGTNDIGIYTGGTNNAGGTLRFDVSATAATSAVPVNIGGAVAGASGPLSLFASSGNYWVAGDGTDIRASLAFGTALTVLTLGKSAVADGKIALPSGVLFVSDSGGTNRTKFIDTGLAPVAASGAALGTSLLPWGVSYFGTNALATTSTDGIILQNTTAATGGTTVQISPRSRWVGTAWDTAASQTVAFFAEVLPVTAATPTGTWKLGYSLNGAAATYLMTVNSAGTLTVAQDLTAGAGRFIGWAGGRTRLFDPGTDGQFNIQNSAATAGIGIDAVTDAVMKVRVRAQNAYATVDVLGVNLSGVPSILTTAPTVSSGFGSAVAGTIVSGSSSFTWRVNIGTNAGGTTGVLGLPTATTFWNCFATDLTNPLDLTRMTASNTTSATFTTTIAWTTADVIVGECHAS